jgi:succinate dehydrogenase / fumarate reductase membrane anchor subunit
MANTTANAAPPTVRRIPKGYDSIAWRWMRYSAFLLIPLAFGHVLIQDVIFGVHNINLTYVSVRWANLFWRVYDAFLLTFAFAHGMNGLRQVLGDYITAPRTRQVLAWLLLLVWLAISLIGSIALIGGVK